MVIARKRNKVSRRMLFTWLGLAGFILLFLPQSFTSKFQSTFTHVFRLPLSIGRNITLSTHMRQPVEEALARREAQYQNYIANLEQELRQEREKVEKLSGLRNRRSLEGAKLVFADVITASIDSSRAEITINRGLSDSIGEGQYVLGDNSIIGRVCEASSRTVRIKLVTDPASNIPIKIAGVSRVMCGDGAKLATIGLLKKKVKIGKNVYADRQPGFLDSPMIVGKVAGCKKNQQNPLLWDVTVKPTCEIEKLKKVAVIIMNPR